jgi:DNA polymerase-1
MKPKLYLIDGTALIYRAYYAFINRPLRNSAGENTSAIYGTISMFLKLIEKFESNNIIISFDRKEKTFRHELDEKYKANRPPIPDELITQFEPVKEFFSAIEMPEVSLAGYEADDIIATLAKLYEHVFQVVIVSGDKDFAQLVNTNITLFDPAKEVELNEANVFEKYGVTPQQFIDYLAICGDSADNIPGVKGIGPKGAVELIQQFGRLENIYQNLDLVKSKSVKQKLQDSEKEAFLSKELAAIKTDLEIPANHKQNMIFSKEKLAKALPFLQKYELHSIIEKLQLQEIPKKVAQEFDFGEEPEPKEFKAILINTKSAFEKMNNSLSKKDTIAIDTETTGLDVQTAELVGISLCGDETEAFYISVAHQWAENLPKEFVYNELKKLFKRKLLLAHNWKYDYQILLNNGWKVENEVFDTMLAHYLLEPNSRHSLDFCAKAEFDYEMIPLSGLIGKGKKQITFAEVSVEEAAQYSAEDAFITFRLYQILKGRLIKADLWTLYKHIELPLLFVLADMENDGVYIDTAILHEISKENQKRMAVLTKQIYEIAGYQFNLNSTQQLAKVLFDDLQIDSLKKTKTGFSTNIDVLEKLAETHEIARYLIDYRQLTKLESTYVAALPNLINAHTGRVHSSFNQTVATTGRLSSSNPNLQNIPIRSEQGREIRKAFAVENDKKVILSADYSQIELRLLAMLAHDEKMLSAFREGKDIHRQTASLVFNVALHEVSPEQRSYAKTINFGLIYGMGATRISKELNISRKNAEQFIENYFAQFPTIKKFLEESVAKAKKFGYAETIFGRKLALPDIYNKNKMLQSEAERVAVNMPIQGSAADIIKIAMIHLHEKLKGNPAIKMIIQVHDELVFEVAHNELEKAKTLIRTEMENALPEEYRKLTPLVVDIGTGKNWFEAH